MGLWNSNYHSFSLDWHEEKQFHWLFGLDLSHPLACPMYHTEDALPSNLCQNKVGGAVPKSEITHSSGKHTSSCCIFWFGKNSPGFRFCMSIRGCLKFEGSDWNCKSGPTRGSMPSQSTWPCGRRGCRPPPPAMDRSGGGCLRGPRLGTSSYSPPAPPPQCSSGRNWTGIHPRPYSYTGSILTSGIPRIVWKKFYAVYNQVCTFFNKNVWCLKFCNKKNCLND